ncbi:MAG TPA: polysaccharide biosynthesis protein [Rugosimonospora sp.]|nr:polysaccharide biosynthesis protein [Rugosimonospora sp.]
MSASDDILHEIRETALPQQTCLDKRVRERLTGLTERLLGAHPDAGQEFDYYLGIRERGIPVPEAAVAAAVAGATVVVTGGSGCVGTALMSALAGLAPGRLTSLSITPPARRVPGVRYQWLDVRSREDVVEYFRRHRPDLVFHLAAQRDPGLAEQQVTRTACTNVLGTHHVMGAAEQAGVPRVVYASTGKAMRPYTSDVYASSKRVGEWVAARAAARGTTACSAARFTHVVDNSIILDRLLRWCRERAPVRLHCPETLFYAQSALESAQLLLVAATAPDDGVCRLHTIRDLGWPVHLLGLALGVMRSAGTVAPLYVAGHDPGYEERPYPGLYDPALAGDVSPLLNALEATQVQSAASPAVDAVPAPAVEVPRLQACLSELAQVNGRHTDTAVRQVLDDGAYALLQATARAAPAAVVNRIARLAQPYRASMPAEHLRIDDVFRRECAERAGRRPGGVRPVSVDGHGRVRGRRVSTSTSDSPGRSQRSLS